MSKTAMETDQKCPNCGSPNGQAIHFDGDGGYQILCDNCGTAYWYIVEPSYNNKETSLTSTE
jgi:transcription elongation factor Elf1